MMTMPKISECSFKPASVSEEEEEEEEEEESILQCNTSCCSANSERGIFRLFSAILIYFCRHILCDKTKIRWIQSKNAVSFVIECKHTRPLPSSSSSSSSSSSAEKRDNDEPLVHHAAEQQLARVLSEQHDDDVHHSPSVDVRTD